MSRAFVAATIFLLATIAEAAAQATPFPRPRPRPPGSELQLPAIPLPRPRPMITPEPQPAADAEPAPPSACLLRLVRALAQATPVLNLTGPGECGAEDVVLLSGVATRTGNVTIAPPATLRCPMAEAVVHWVRDDLAPAALALGAPLAAVANFASYECRGRNRVVGAQLSEHGKANALDVRALKLADGRTVELTDVKVAKEIREKVRADTCARFLTVLGPGSDGYHENHIHVDLRERRHGYRMCQWTVRVPAEDIPLPRERPPEAPPRAEAVAR